MNNWRWVCLAVLMCMSPWVWAEDQPGDVHISLFHETSLSTHGFEFGLFNDVQRDYSGFQLGVVSNITHRELDGFQASLLYNEAGEEMHGLQMGLINHTGSLQGVQIGLLNFNDDTKYKGFFPFIDAAF